MAKKKSKLPVVNRGYATVSVMKTVEPEVETETSTTTATTTTATEPGSGQPGIETPDGVKGRGKKEKRKGKRGQPSGQDEEETTSTLTPREETLLREISVAKHRADKRIESQQGLVQHTTDEAILRWDGTTVDGSRVVDVAGDMPLANDLWIATATDDPSIFATYEDATIFPGTARATSAQLTVYYTLRGYGFTEEDVKNAMNASGGLDVDMAMAWLCTHTDCLPGDLRIPGVKYKDRSSEAPIQLLETRTQPLPVIHHVDGRAPKGATHLVQLSKDKRADQDHLKDLFASHPGKDQASDVSSRAPPIGDSKEEEKEGEEEKEEEEEEDDDQEDDEDDDDPNALYAKCRIRIMRLERLMKKSPTEEARKKEAVFRRELDSYQNDVLFDKHVADGMFNVQAKIYYERLQQAALTPVMPKTDIPRAQKTTVVEVDEVFPAGGALGEEEGSEEEEEEVTLLGGVFEQMEEQTAQASPLPHSPVVEELPPLPDHISVEDVTYSKTWSGASPKDVLRNHYRNINRAIKVTWSSLPLLDGKYYQARVDRVWPKGDDGGCEDAHIQMEDVACETLEEAHNYVATLALYRWLAPMPLYRVLPPVFRDIWLRLKEEEDGKERQDTLEKANSAIDLLNAIPTKPTLLLSTRSTSSWFASQKEAMSEEWSVDVQGAGHERTLVDLEERKTRLLASSPSFVALSKSRLSLPIYQYRQQLMRLVQDNNVFLLVGETGCGKTTQMPQFSLEYLLSSPDHHGRIICTQPRRISATSISKRVSEEIGDGPGGLGGPDAYVGYQIRLDNRSSPANRLIFCTAGILLRHMEIDPTLHGIDMLILDEIQERSMEMDFLLILLTKLIQERPTLKVIIMSATMDTEKLAAYFDGCPTIRIPGRTFPVETLFLEDAIQDTHYSLEEGNRFRRKTETSLADAIDAIADQASRGEKRGTVKAALDRARKGTAKEGVKEKEAKRWGDIAAQLSDGTYTDDTLSTLFWLDEQQVNDDLIFLLVQSLTFGEMRHRSPGAILVFLPGIAEIRRVNALLLGDERFRDPKAALIIQLHSMLAGINQEAAFNEPPEGVRKIVLTTNIAETGITIPDVTVVIDGVRAKQTRYDTQRRMTHLEETFISRANGRQRRGRAGRVSEGLCYHLVMRHRFEHKLLEFPVPEIQRMSLDELGLRAKLFGYPVLREFWARALDPPSEKAILNATVRLKEIGAIGEEGGEEALTPLGLLISHLPLDTRLGKMIICGLLMRCLDPILTVAAGLSYQSPFVAPREHISEGSIAESKRSFALRRTRGDWRRPEENSSYQYGGFPSYCPRSIFQTGASDFITLVNVYNAWAHVKETGDGAKARKFCRLRHLDPVVMEMIHDLRRQYYSQLVQAGLVPRSAGRTPEIFLNRTKDTFAQSANEYAMDEKIVGAAVFAALQPRVAYRLSAQAERRGDWTAQKGGYCTKERGDAVFIGRQSILQGDDGALWLTYNELMKTGTRPLMRDVADVPGVTLAMFAHRMAVEPLANMIVIDGWIRFHCPCPLAYMILIVRNKLMQTIQQVTMDPIRTIQDKNWGRWLETMRSMLTTIRHIPPKEARS